MSRFRLKCWCCPLAGSLALALAAPAQADVLEIGESGAVWIAGGPATGMVPLPGDDAAQAATPVDGATSVPMTEIATAAGPAQWQPRVAELAAKYDISPRLLEALVWQESRWHSGAVSPVGARGFAQLMPGTARQLGVDSSDPNANLEGGARYLRQQLDAFDGDVERALAAYNAGPKRVIDAGGIPRIRETQGYVAAIMARLADPVRR